MEIVSRIKDFIKKRPWLTALIILGVLALTVLPIVLSKPKASLPPEQPKDQQAGQKTSPKAEQKPPLQSPATETTTPTNAVSSTKVFGSIVSVKTSQLVFQVSGYIEQVFVQNGTLVKAGTTLAKLDDAISLEQLRLAEYNLEQAKQNVTYTKLSFERTKTLMARQATTQIAYEQAESAYKAAEIQLKTAMSNLNLARINQKNTTLKAPFTGYVLNLKAWQGDYVSSSTPILTLVSLDDLQIEVPIPQTIINHFAVGDELPFTNTSKNVQGVLVVSGVVPYVDPNSKSYLLVGKPTKVEGTLLAGELVVIDLKDARKANP